MKHWTDVQLGSDGTANAKGSLTLSLTVADLTGWRILNYFLTTNVLHPKLFSMIEELALGDHVAFFFKTNEERLAHAIPYIKIGLQKGERCLYIADENTPFEIMCGLEAYGVNVREAQKKGSLTVLTKRETYLRYGLFEPEKMITDLNNEVKFSLEHGFTGFRASGEMSWALDLPSALSRLTEYEEKLQAAWPAEFGGLCQYNETLFSPTLVEKMIGLHSVILRDGKISRRRLNSNSNPLPKKVRPNIQQPQEQ